MASLDRKKRKYRARTKMGNKIIYLGYFQTYYAALLREYEYLQENCEGEGCLHDFCYKKRTTKRTGEELMGELR